MLDQRLGVFVEGTGEGDLASEDVLVDTHGVFVVEGIDSSMHFVDEYTQSPPINGFSVTLVKNDFRSDVFWSSANSECSSFVEHFCEPEVSELEIAVVGDQQVLRLQVSEDDIFVVQILETRSDSGCVESCLVGGERLH